jgi:hypothetical protein
MANKNGIITRKDIIEDEALKWGDTYAASLETSIKANKELVDSVKELNKQVQAFKVANSQKDYITAKQAEALATQKAIDAIKIEQAEEIKRQKIQREGIATMEAERKQREVSEKAAQRANTEKERSKKLTIEERLQLQGTRRELILQAKANGVLSSTYDRLNAQRTIAQRKLGELLTSEKATTSEIKAARLEFEKLDARVKAIDSTLNNYSKNIGNYRSAFEGVNKTAKDLISTFGLLTGLALFGQIVKDSFNVIKEFDRQLIAVGKTTDISGEELKKFGREVVELGDKTDGISVQGLLNSAEVAGQLGVTGTQNILKFSEAIEKLKLTSNIISDEQVGNFAKFIEVSSDSFDNADKLASVITELGNSFATTEAEVLGNATEIQKGIAVYNTSAESVLALGAATSTLGSEAESSRSAIQTTFAVIDEAITSGKDLEKILKLTGLTQKELSKQFNKDATGVFVKFVGGLNKAKIEGENLRAILNDVEITEKRAFTVIGSLAANYGILEKSMAQAKQEYIENVALNKEVAAASESLSSIISDIKDRWEAYILSADDANSGSASLAKSLKFLRDNFKEIMDFVVKFGTILLTYIGVMKTVNFITTAWTAIQTAATAGQIRFALATGIGTESILAQAAAARTATVAQEGLNIAVKATPWGLILGFLSAAVVAYMAFNDEMSESEKNIQNIVDANKRLQEDAKKASSERDSANSQRFKQIEEDIRLRKAQGENSDKLDKEEIKRKKQLLEASIFAFKALETGDIERTQTAINLSNQRIAQFQIEKNALEKSGYRVSKQGNTEDELTDLIASEKEKLNFNKATLDKKSKLVTEEENRLKKQIQDLDKNAAIKDAEIKAEVDKKALAARKKHLRELYDARKKAFDDEFKLSQFRYQVAIDLETEILANEKSSYDDRIDALYDANQLMASKIKEAAEYELKSLGKYNENSGKFIRELSDLEIKTLIETGNTKKKLTSEQQLIYEKFQNEQTKIAKKQEEERLKLIDGQVVIVQKQIDDELLNQETKLNAAIEAENIKFMAINKAEEQSQKEREAAIEAHERQVYEIKKRFALDALKVQIDAIQKELDLDALKPISEQISADKRKQIEAQLQAAKTEYSQIGYEQYLDQNDDIIKNEVLKATDILEISSQLSSALTDLTNSIFETKIKNIEYEIDKNNEYYDKQIELAGNDARQKDLLEKERQKKNDELEKKKRKEQHKQAVYNKASAVAQAGISTALAILSGLNTKPFLPLGPIMAKLAGVLGAVQIGAILATPIPKYKHGRNGGKEEFAYVGDGGVSEVIERKRGGIEITPATDTLVKLYEGDKVHSSIDAYNRLQRASIMASIDMQGRKMSDFQATQFFENRNKELVEEMRLTRKAIEKNKSSVIVKTEKLDINHHLWKMKNTNWN